MMVLSLSRGVRILLKTNAPSSICHRHISYVMARPSVRANPMQVLCFTRPTAVVVTRLHQSDATTDATTQPTTDAERRLTDKLQKTFPKASDIRVIDISGGCGSMFEVHIMSEEFRGVRTVMQHRMVNEALKDEIKNMHGLRISTSEPEV